MENFNDFPSQSCRRDQFWFAKSVTYWVRNEIGKLGSDSKTKIFEIQK